MVLTSLSQVQKEANMKAQQAQSTQQHREQLEALKKLSETKAPVVNVAPAQTRVKVVNPVTRNDRAGQAL